jgi:hypothetical protein
MVKKWQWLLNTILSIISYFSKNTPHPQYIFANFAKIKPVKKLAFVRITKVRKNRPDGTLQIMMTRWEDLLVAGPATGKIRDLINNATQADPDAAWLAWGKLVRKRAESLDLVRYRAAVHWCYAQAQTQACFDNEVPMAIEWSEIAATGQSEYRSLAGLLTHTLLTDGTETQTSRQWTGRLLGFEQLLNDLAAEHISVEHQPLLHQVLCAETPWLIGCQFPDLAVGQRLLQFARENFRLGLAETLDGSGLPHASDIMLLRPLLACWTRALMLGKKAKLRPWPMDEHHQFEWAVLHTLRLMRRDGSEVFDEVAPNTTPRKTAKHDDTAAPFEFEPIAEMMRHALAFDTDEVDHAVARTLFPRQFAARQIAKTRTAMTQKPKSSAKSASLTSDVKAVKQTTAELAAGSDATYFSEWSQLAVLRSGWDFREPSLAVDFSPNDESGESDRWTDQSVTVELNLGNQTWWSGIWEVVVKIDGRTLQPTDTWSTTCETVEEGGCYFEIELPLTENMRLQRHLLLCHKEKLLLLADSVLPQYEDNVEEGVEHHGHDDARYAMEYESQLPLVAGIGVKSSNEMTELLLTCPTARTGATSNAGANVGKSMRVFPLALPEWIVACESGADKPSDFVSGALECAGTSDGQRLILRQNAFGRAMFAPMLFDLDAKRVKQPYTWRQLTVGENRESVARDLAVAFRLQIDKMHVLLYRTMASALNRTFFGHNLVGDFFAGRFDAKTGKVSTIVETE